MTSGPLPQCAVCAHLRMDPLRTCAAFPAGIPEKVWSNRLDHRRPLAGDRGVVWEPLTAGESFPTHALRDTSFQQSKARRQ